MMAHQNPWGIPDLGLGLGLRTRHFPHILEQLPKLGFFEIISENFMFTGGRPRQVLETLTQHYPFVMHGVSLGIGGTDPLNWDYLRALKKLADDIDVVWLGDHVCWTGVAGKNGHDLYPLPMTEESLQHVVERLKRVQDFLQRPMIMENPSTYLQFQESTIPEAEFMARMAEGADCGLLLDVNNIYVTCFNHGLDAAEYLATIPLDRVVQIHLAGHTNHESHCIDTHDGPVIDAVWDLYRRVIQKAGPISTLLEWDDNIPEFPVVYDELQRAAQYRPAAAVQVHD